MQTTIMAHLQTNASRYVGNATTIPSPLNSYLALIYVISNLIRMAQPQGGLRYIPQVMSPLTTSFLLFVRQQMDKSNYDMVNMITQKIDILFNPLIQKHKP